MYWELEAVHNDFEASREQLGGVSWMQNRGWNAVFASLAIFELVHRLHLQPRHHDHCSSLNPMHFLAVCSPTQSRIQ